MLSSVWRAGIGWVSSAMPPRRVGRAERDPGRDAAQPAGAPAHAQRMVAAAVGDESRGSGKQRIVEMLQAARHHFLVDELQRDADRVVRAELQGERGRYGAL